LAEEVGQKAAAKSGSGGILLQFVYYAAEQHRLALAGITPDPEQSALFVIVPLLKFGIFEDPAVRAFQQATLRALDALLVLARICYP